MTPETEAEGGLRNIVAAIASTLRPSAMIAFPPLSATLLPCTVPLPGALLLPSPLLLPRGCLLPRTLRLLLLPDLLGGLCLLLLRPLLLSLLLDPLLLLLRLLSLLLDPLLLRLRLLSLLLGPLLLRLRLLSRLLRGLLGPLLLRLLSGLCALLRLLLLSARLRCLRLSLRALLLCRWPRALGLLTLLLFRRIALFFPLLVLLRVCRDNRPEKQKQGSGTGSSNELHSNGLH